MPQCVQKLSKLTLIEHKTDVYILENLQIFSEILEVVKAIRASFYNERLR